jgi:hypothetical protein
MDQVSMSANESAPPLLPPPLVAAADDAVSGSGHATTAAVSHPPPYGSRFTDNESNGRLEEVGSGDEIGAHYRVECDGCHASLVDAHYRCRSCKSFHLCVDCWTNGRDEHTTAVHTRDVMMRSD